MLSSSHDYLQALRHGHYLRFLEWPQFIVQHYATQDHPIGADEAINLIIFEWLNHGFCEEDIRHMALLTAVYDLDTNPIRAELAYAFTSLSISLTSCMVYQSTNLQRNLIKSEPVTARDITLLIREQGDALDGCYFAEQLELENRRLQRYKESLDKDLVIGTYEQINAMTQPRYLTDEYITVLEHAQIANDQLHPSRLSLIKRLAQYLKEQTEYTEQVKEEIGVYVARLWEMNPAPFEEEYLNALSTGTSIANLWKMAVSYGLMFFSILQPSTLPSITDETLDKSAKM
ncbi:helical bundle domain-containing protein [Legionella worsleiensis]|uniref:Uncharacterized protein n=1 Tax=Legionella worsleiensis TaxID=45076 RepID=A0A0W1AJY9_9GAMM|nr:helical bundle domain-containing protein [Legionella worsleiensis]KTD81676.1 hypothetical protein Lwor_0458 [Legionella worsleiensis]STY31914.1 Uncharacterised protein [Legionella worsleiensis]